ncbi:hypothetical protein [Methanolobus sp. WCC5]|uniref:hypothetical protein n=1 Tax=Methanolobus sp. WCC5 TaxID=3125785 RepID=UPI0032460DDA
MAPINPAFIEYQKELEQEQKQEQENTDPETSVSEDIFIMALSGESSGSASTEKLSSQLFFNEIATDEDLLHTTGLIPSPVDLSFVSSSGNVAAVSPASGQTMPDAQPYPGSSQEKPASSLMALSGLLVVTTVASVYRMKRSK